MTRSSLSGPNGFKIHTKERKLNHPALIQLIAMFGQKIKLHDNAEETDCINRQLIKKKALSTSVLIGLNFLAR
jgi:hypothetical protein